MTVGDDRDKCCQILLMSKRVKCIALCTPESVVLDAYVALVIKITSSLDNSQVKMACDRGAHGHLYRRSSSANPRICLEAPALDRLLRQSTNDDGKPNGAELEAKGIESHGDEPQEADRETTDRLGLSADHVIVRTIVMLVFRGFQRPESRSLALWLHTKVVTRPALVLAGAEEHSGTRRQAGVKSHCSISPKGKRQLHQVDV